MQPAGRAHCRVARAGQCGQGRAGRRARQSPKLRSDAKRARINAGATRAALNSAELAADPNRERLGKLGIDVEQFQAESRAAGEELARLRMTAGFAALWTDLDPALTVGSWLRPQDPIGTLVAPHSWKIEARVLLCTP